MLKSKEALETIYGFLVEWRVSDEIPEREILEDIEAILEDTITQKQCKRIAR